MRQSLPSRRKGNRGSTLVEFSLIALLLIMIIFTMFEMDRMVLVMTALADSTRAGMRYAIVHGSDNTVTAAQIKTVITNYASTGIINTARLNVPTLTYTPNNSPGSKVDITVTYVYDPFTSYFPLSVTLSSTSQGIITY
jgi:Flp pilus assembly protein TadG